MSHDVEPDNPGTAKGVEIRREISLLQVAGPAAGAAAKISADGTYGFRPPDGCHRQTEYVVLY